VSRLPKTYAEVAAMAGVPVPLLWDRASLRVTRSGVRRLLMQAYVIETYKDPPWLRLWKQVQWVRLTAKNKVHIVIPSELWDEDKARLAAKIAATRDVSYPEEKERALRWARR
jgi:hypothetical protein